MDPTIVETVPVEFYTIIAGLAGFSSGVTCGVLAMIVLFRKWRAEGEAILSGS